MTVKIDELEPNIFPHVDDLDARDAGRNVEVFLDVTIEGKQTPVTVKLSYERDRRGPSLNDRHNSSGATVPGLSQIPVHHF
jgi:hypothetical protein